MAPCSINDDASSHNKSNEVTTDTEPNELDTKKKEVHALTPCTASLALLSAIVGGGIVGIPYAMFHTGIPLGIVLNVGIAVMCYYTGTLYLRVKDMSPTYVESLFELGFVTMGTKSIYVLAGIIVISGVGCTMIYFIVFSNISASLAQTIQDEGTDNIMTDRTIYVLSLAVLMLPLCLKKMLKEMKVVSIILFASIAVFIGLFIIQLCTLGSIENHDKNYSRYYHVDFGLELITGFNIIVLAYAYHNSFFPTYNSLAEKSYKNGMKFVAIASALTVGIYVSLGILSIYTFGSEIGPSIIANVDEEQNVFSYIIRVSFLLLLACHIPYIFFPTKESFLIIIDEAQNLSMTKALQYKI